MPPRSNSLDSFDFALRHQARPTMSYILNLIMPRYACAEGIVCARACVRVCVCVYVCVFCMSVTRVSRRPLQARHWRVQCRHNATISQI